jgi:hypothetical protein
VLQCMHLLLLGSPFPAHHGCLHKSSTVRGVVLASRGGAAEAQLLRETDGLLAHSMQLGLNTHCWVLPKTAARRGCDAWSETLAASGGASFKRSITLLNELLPGLELRLLGRVQRAPWHAPPTLRQFRISA